MIWDINTGVDQNYCSPRWNLYSSNIQIWRIPASSSIKSSIKGSHKHPTYIPCSMPPTSATAPPSEASLARCQHWPGAWETAKWFRNWLLLVTSGYLYLYISYIYMTVCQLVQNFCQLCLANGHIIIYIFKTWVWKSMYWIWMNLESDQI